MTTFGSADARTTTVCPFLGTLDTLQKAAPYVEYPCFENRCFASDRPAALMLTDQATFCLSQGHRHCPRFVAACAARGGLDPPRAQRAVSSPGRSPLDSDQISHDIQALTAEATASTVTRRSQRKVWGWIGAGIIFVFSLVCGGLFAAWAGWQMVNTSLIVPQPGRIATLSQAATPLPPQIYLIVTATTAPAAVQPQAAAPAGPAAQQGFEFPVAVTATPVVVNPSLAQSAAQPQFPDQPVVGVDSAPTLGIDLAVPTRRPTPILDLERVVPVTLAPTDILLPTATPTPALGTPFVLFAAADTALETGDCTTVGWDVENVRAVYYENLGVDGHGEKEECMKDRRGEYTLAVVLSNGATQLYTVTVDLIPPTETPTVTPTFTPEPVLTPTWTPTPVTPTPTPDYQYGALLAVEDGSHHVCVPGAACEVGLLVTNTSITIDNLAAVLAAKGDWTARLCRLDGVCADESLILMNVGPSNTAFIVLRVQVPEDAAGTTQSYAVQAISQGSQGSATSDVVDVQIEVE